MASTPWEPERALRLDPRYAYLHILKENTRPGIRVVLPKRIYRPREGIVKVTSLTEMFALDYYRSWEETVIAAKQYRNEHVESILGDQFMNYGFVARRQLSAANSSGHVGVTEDEWGCFRAYWREHVDASQYDITPTSFVMPRRQRGKTFRADNDTKAARNRAYKAACDYADQQRAIFYPAKAALQRFVLNDCAAENDDYVGLSALLNGGHNDGIE